MAKGPVGNFECALQNALKLFRSIPSLKNEQKECLQQLVVERRDVLAILPTGFGKSIIYQLIPRMFEEKSTVLVVSPLESIRDQQKRKLDKVGMFTVDLSEEDSVSRVTDAEFVFGSAEQWLSARGKEAIKSILNPVALVIDEAHTTETWGIGKKGKKAFREAFGRLNEMRSFLGQVPVLCLTATADKGMRKRLVNYLALQRPHKVIMSPNKDNIRFSVQQGDKDLYCLNWVVKMVEEEKENCPYSIIFCQTVNDIVIVLSFLLTKLGQNAYTSGEAPIAERCLISVYYSVTPQKLKERVRSSFENGTGSARIVIATTSLSMGIDFPNVTYVIHFGPARDLVSHLQEAGRAGRDGVSQAHNVIVYLGKHKALCTKEMLQVLKSKECVRKELLSSFEDDANIVPKHNCCNRCHLECKCGSGGICTLPLPVFDKEAVTQQYTGPTRTVTEEDRECLRNALFEVKASLGGQTKVSLFDKSGTISHGFSNNVIESIVANCDKLFTVVDIMQMCFLSSPRLTLTVLEILYELFGDFQPSSIDYKLYQTTETMVAPLLMQDMEDISFDEFSDYEENDYL